MKLVSGKLGHDLNLKDDKMVSTTALIASLFAGF